MVESRNKMKINNIFIKTLYLLFFNFYSINVKSNYVIFDLKTYKNNSDYPNEYEKFFYDTLYNILYTEIPLGPNKEKYIMEIKASNLFFSIYNHNCEIPPVHNSKNYSYSENFANSKVVYSHFSIFGENNASLLENTIYIQTNKGEKSAIINYIFSPRDNHEDIQYTILRPYTCFQLGFEYIPQNSEIDKINDLAMNLIMQFKRANITSSYKWFIEYNSKNIEKGNLILGASAYEYNPKKYDEEKEKKVQAKIRQDYILYWELEMNDIYLKNSTNMYRDNYINLYLICSLEPSLGVIFAPSGYQNYIKENLFNSPIVQKKCFKSPLILDTYITYYCLKDIKEVLKKNFDTIIFLHRYLNKSFELNYDDLFVEKGNYIYFLVFFDRFDSEIWKFGKPFLSKYFFSYDLEGRTISFYDVNDNKGGSNNTLKIILIVVLICIIAVIGFFIGKFIYGNKKRDIGTELNETDDYDFKAGLDQ